MYRKRGETMQDFHDADMVNWRMQMLESIETFSDSSIIMLAPRKHRTKRWVAFLFVLIILTIGCSFLLRDTYQWFSEMLGNISAGLIASIILLLFTESKDRNRSYFGVFVPQLRNTIREIEHVENNLHVMFYSSNLYNEFASPGVLSQYYDFFLKFFLYYKTISQVYDKVIANDRLEYNHFLSTQDQLHQMEIKIDDLKTDISLSYEKRDYERVKVLHKEVMQYWNKAILMKRSLGAYAAYAETSLYILEY